jgi:hypothetical protein
LPSILKKLFGRRAAAPERGTPAVSLGLFGKHPAWNDFCDDIGLETQRLIDLKRLLFQGVDTNIAQWEHLHEQQRLDGFRHVLVWSLGECLLAGRLWSSSDGKGRTRYPMAACADCCGLPLPAVLGHILPALEQVQREVAAARTQEAVYAAADAHRAALRKWAETGAPPAAAPVGAMTPGGAAARLMACTDLGERGKGVVSLLYRLEQEAPDSLAWGDPAGGDTRTLVNRPAFVRVPACATSPADAALLWSRFLEGVLSRRAPQLIVLPLGERWADVIVGEPTGASLYCLRANEKGIPLTSDIPYTIDAGFAERAGQFLAKFARPDTLAGAPASVAQKL